MASHSLRSLAPLQGLALNLISISASIPVLFPSIDFHLLLLQGFLCTITRQSKRSWKQQGFVSCIPYSFWNTEFELFLIFFLGLINLQKAVRANVDGAQLRANVDGALLVTNGAAAGKGPEAEKAVQKKVAVKTKPEAVIELSSDTEEVKKEKPINTKKTGEGSSRKKVQTMTSILTSRSKVIFG